MAKHMDFELFMLCMRMMTPHVHTVQTCAYVGDLNRPVRCVEVYDRRMKYVSTFFFNDNGRIHKVGL